MSQTQLTFTSQCIASIKKGQNYTRTEFPESLNMLEIKKTEKSQYSPVTTEPPCSGA